MIESGTNGSPGKAKPFISNKGNKTMTKTISIAVFIIVGLFMTPFSAHAQVYKWIDDKGDVHFTDDYSSIPEKYRPVAETQRPPKEPPPASVEKKPAPAPAPKLSEPPVQKTQAVQKKPQELSEVFEGVVSKLDDFARSFVVTDKANKERTMSFRISEDTKIIDELRKEVAFDELRRRVETNPSTGITVTVKYTREKDDIHTTSVTLHGKQDFDGRDSRKTPRPPKPSR